MKISHAGRKFNCIDTNTDIIAENINHEDRDTKAIQTCKLDAPEIASKLSGKHKWLISRTSLKTRNPANAPDV